MRYIVLVALLLASCNAIPQQQLIPVHCQAQNGMSDIQCTPGVVFANVTAAQVCKAGYAASVRDVPQSVKNKVYAEYGVTSHASGQYEIDHDIPIETGGSNDIKNLWPEAALPKPGFHEKDQVENYLHAQVCSGKMTLGDAQTKIVANWKQFLANIQ